VCYERNAMNRTGLIALAGVLTAAATWIALHDRDDTRLPAAVADGGVDAAVSASASANAVDGGVEPPANLDAGLALESPPVFDEEIVAENPVGELTNAPKSLTFGVILVQYEGAQGAKQGARSKAEARGLADELAREAQSDFAAAVKRGDPGSTGNAGRMFRGILEPRPEFTLFSLQKGEVSQSVDTPRGFWIVKRLN